MCAADLDEAIELANDQPFGLTSGIQSLDDREIARWLERIEAGNLYVNRPITGAIVGRQPFGGWKASSVGPGAKAGGPNYVLQLCRARLAEATEAEPGAVRDAAAGYERAWREHFSTTHEPIRLLGERNLFRYRPCRGVLVRGEAASPSGRLALEHVRLAARACGVPLALSLAAGEAGFGSGAAGDAAVVVESEAELIARLGGAGCERLRALVPLSRALRAAAHAAGLAVLDAPVVDAGRLELRHYLREQTVSHLVHRYGSVPLAPLTVPSPRRGEGEG
jgi:RHH-type proline utilization regulon transcriptional repressor/proline dehydrogenase/delta 1-pyrroline-5-carboxylate dehydrogenase